MRLLLIKRFVRRSLFLIASGLIVLTLLYNFYAYKDDGGLSLREAIQSGIVTFDYRSLWIKRHEVQFAADIRRDFMPTLTENQTRVLEKSVRALVAALQKHNVSYHMCGGMLLGSYLHHGMIPWDDDLDLCVLVSDRVRLLNALNSTAPEFAYVKPSWQDRYKFFSSYESTDIGRQEIAYRVPFIDVCLCGEDNDTIWDLSMGKKEQNDKRFNKSMIFPLARRPFMNLSLSAPRQTLAYLKHNYDLKRCVSNRWSHVKETYAPRKERRVTCETLYAVYPFVFRTKLGNRTVETLRVGNRTLATVIVDGFDSPANAALHLSEVTVFLVTLHIVVCLYCTLNLT